MAGETLTLRRVCKLWLRRHGFDGLCSKHCGCELDDLMPCGDGRIARCRPGYRTPVLDRPGYVFIGLDAGRSPRRAAYAAHPDPDVGSCGTARSRHGPPPHQIFRLPDHVEAAKAAVRAGRHDHGGGK